ncbi:hypothetical protein [Helicobacter mastomyrinus]|uniref:Uncharacterized protein n=1 Tax=Helicobacter mastomyrinus TaxID=287948 RepID=A0ABZ3F757_9HELI|nr:hypothetical protein [uncultured Helicobacter sp.]
MPTSNVSCRIRAVVNLKGLVDSKLSFMPSFVMWFVSGGGGQ